MGTEILERNFFKLKSNKDSLYSFLKNIPLFEGFSSRDIKNIEKIVHLRKFKKDEIVFKEDEPGTGMYIIKNGSIRITKQNKDEDGSVQEETVFNLHQNDFLGELSLIEKDSFARTASAYTDCESELVGFFKPDLLEIIEKNPKLGIKLIMRISEIIAARLRSTTAALSEKKKEIVLMHASLNGEDVQGTIG